MLSRMVMHAWSWARGDMRGRQPTVWKRARPGENVAMFQRRVAQTHRARGAFVEALGALGEHVL